MYVLDDMEANTDVDAIGISTDDVRSVSPGSHRSDSDGVALFDGDVTEAHDDSSVTETLAVGNGSTKCGIAKWSKRAKMSSWNDVTHNLRTRVNRRPIPGKVHKKRQTLQDMARPLKRWLCRNRNNPYPTKTEKMTLASDASMTITQVSNWFANARRRLKTTVTQPQMSWASRISLYNSFVVGNQELLSLSSDDTLWDADPGSNDAAISNDGDYPASSTAATPRAEASTIAARAAADDSDWPSKNDNASFGNWREHRVTSHPLAQYEPSLEGSGDTSADHVSYSDDIIAHKYKQTILQRYLNDARQYALGLPDDSGKNRHRNLSGSLSSHDYEELSTSARSTPTREQTTEGGSQITLSLGRRTSDKDLLGCLCARVDVTKALFSQDIVINLVKKSQIAYFLLLMTSLVITVCYIKLLTQACPVMESGVDRPGKRRLL